MLAAVRISSISLLALHSVGDILLVYRAWFPLLIRCFAREDY